MTDGLRGDLGVVGPLIIVGPRMPIVVGPRMPIIIGPRMPIGRPPALATATAAISPSGMPNPTSVDRRNNRDILCFLRFWFDVCASTLVNATEGQKRAQSALTGA